MATVSALIMTLNEAANLAACLDSLRWTDEIVVIDSGSTDETVAIAQRYGARVVHHRWPGYAAQLNYGHTQVSEAWTLVLGADERVTAALQAEIESILQDPTRENAYDAYRIPIRDWMFGRFVRHGSWPRQHHLRLYRSGQVVWQGAVHEQPETRGRIGQLTQPLLHFSHTTIARFLDKLNRYTEIEARELFDRQVRSNLLLALAGAGRAFMGQYLRLQGFRDGGHGLILAILMAFYFFTTRAKLWSLWYQQDHPEGQ